MKPPEAPQSRAAEPPTPRPSTPPTDAPRAPPHVVPARPRPLRVPLGCRREATPPARRRGRERGAAGDHVTPAARGREGAALAPLGAVQEVT